jgi:histidinol-phosphate aminotransferase
MSAALEVERRPDPSLQAPAYVRDLAPYTPGKPIGELAREFGLAERDIVKLASNENPRGPSAAVRRAIAAATEELCRYPDGNGFALKAALSAKYGVAADTIVLGNGSNDVLELVTQAFLRPGDHAVYSRHAFAVYPLAVHARGAIGIEVPARDYGHDLPAMRAAITPSTRVVFSPIRTIRPARDHARCAARVHRVDPRRRVAGRAYNEYLGPGECAPRRMDRRTPISSRTFSKAYGHALRVGWGHERQCRKHAESRAPAVQRQRAPGRPRSRPRRPATSTRVARSITGMRELEAGARALGLAFVPSHGNFILIRVGENAGAVYERLLKQGVIVRPVANYGLPEFLRVTVGLPAENRRFLDALSSALAR